MDWRIWALGVIGTGVLAWLATAWSKWALWFNGGAAHRDTGALTIVGGVKAAASVVWGPTFATLGSAGDGVFGLQGPDGLTEHGFTTELGETTAAGFGLIRPTGSWDLVGDGMALLGATATHGRGLLARAFFSGGSSVSLFSTGALKNKLELMLHTPNNFRKGSATPIHHFFFAVDKNWLL